LESKENVKCFNQRFITLINKIPLASNLVDDVSIELYTSSLPISMEMFVKKEKKDTMEGA
jgi:hypothetical protein